MKKFLEIIILSIIIINVLIISCNVDRESTNSKSPMKEKLLGRFIIHDDFSNLMMDLSEPADQRKLEATAKNLANSGADIISLRVSDGERVYCVYS
jgi:uncharacterized membrane protein affecting hemolysin expression